jgi:DNA repair photolyase
LEAILAEPGWTVRILTKNAAVERDFDLIQQHRERVLVGLSLTGPIDKAATIKVVEPNASTIAERMAAMEKAHSLGLRTFGMFCPLLPGIADDAEVVQQLVEFGMHCGVEEIFVEPVNTRGPGLKVTERVLRDAGFCREADAIAQIRHQQEWSSYVTRLLNNVQEALRAFGALEKLRFLLYPSRLSPGDRNWIRDHGEGVRWLGDDAATDRIQTRAMAGQRTDPSVLGEVCYHSVPRHLQEPRRTGQVLHEKPD